MANAGIKSTQAGTSLRSIMTNLTGDIKIAGDAIGEVTIATTNADGSMRSFNDIIMEEAFITGNGTGKPTGFLKPWWVRTPCPASSPL